MALRIKSLAVAAPSIEQLCTKFAARLKEAKPDALLWLTDSQQTAAVAKVASRACASIGARTDAGLIGGGSEFYGPPGDEARIAALAIQNAGTVTPFYSPPEGLPELDDWASLASAPPEQAPPLFLLAAPPANAGFDLEGWLAPVHESNCRGTSPARHRRDDSLVDLRTGLHAWTEPCRGRRRSAASSAATASS